MADNWISDVPGIRDIIDANGVTLPRAARLKLGPGLTATYSQGVITIASSSGGGGGSGGGSVNLPANPTDDGKLAYASGGNLAYTSSLTYDADWGRLYLPVNHAIYGKSRGGGGGVTILQWLGNALVIGHQATYAAMISSYSEFYADSYFFQIRTFGGGPVVLDYDGLQLPSGLDLVLDDAHLLKNGDYLWSNLGDVGFPLGPFEVPDDISDTTIDVGDVHVGRRNRCTAGTAVTINLKEESTQPIGSYVHFTQVGDGKLEFVPGDGVTALTPETLKSRKKGSTISAYRVTATHWDITGDLELDA